MVNCNEDKLQQTARLIKCRCRAIYHNVMVIKLIIYITLSFKRIHIKNKYEWCQDKPLSHQPGHKGNLLPAYTLGLRSNEQNVETSGKTDLGMERFSIRSSIEGRIMIFFSNGDLN